MTPIEVAEATQGQRQERLLFLREEAKKSHPTKRGQVIGEAILLFLETIKYAKDNGPPELPLRPIEYAKAILSDQEEGSFGALLAPRAMQLFGWTEELENKDTKSGRRKELISLLRNAGLIGGK